MKRGDTKAVSQEIITIAKGAGIVFSGSIIGAILKYSFQIIVARKLGPNLFGLFFLGFSVFKIAGMIAEFGLPNGIIRYVAIFCGEKNRSRIKGIIISAAKFALITSSIISLLLILLSKAIATYLFHNIELTKVLRLFAVAIPFTTITSVLISATQGFKIMKYKVIIKEVFEPLVRIALLVIIFLIGLKLYGVLFAYLIPLVTGTFYSFHCLKKVFPPVIKKELRSTNEMKRLLSFSWPLLFVQFFALLLLWADTIMLGYFKTAQDVGVYGAAQRTVLIGSVIIVSLNSIFSPIISDLYNKREIHKLNYYFKTVARWTFTFSFPIFLFMVIFSKSILNTFGSNFIPGAPCLIILSIGWFIHSSTGSVGQIITMTGRPLLNFINGAGVLGLNLILNLLLIPKYGIIGAAIATSFSIALVNIVSVIEVKFFLNIHPYQLDFFKPLIAGTISFAVSFLYHRYVYQNPTQILFFTGMLIFFISYFILLCLLGIGTDEKILMEKIKEKIFLR
jgi:O-antigen/teichoic acid export membrane protein